MSYGIFNVRFHTYAWREKIIAHMCTFRSSNMTNLIYYRLWVYSRLFEKDPLSNRLRTKSPLECILFQGFYVGWLRNTLVCDNPLSLVGDTIQYVLPTDVPIWANQPIHSFLVGCLKPCLQGTNVHVGSPNSDVPMWHCKYGWPCGNKRTNEW